MKAEFGVGRELEDRLFLDLWESGGGSFHFHSQIEIFFVDHGEGGAWINNRYCLLKEGEMAVSLSYDSHRFYAEEGAKVGCLIIPLRMCGDFLSETKKKCAIDPFITDPKAFQVFRVCVDAIENYKDPDLKTKGLIYVILGTVLEHLELRDRPDAIDADLYSRLLFYINDNYRSDLTLTSIASVFGYNADYLSRYFKSFFHISISRYITLVRLREAILLLKNTNNSVAFCAFESGFTSLRTFYRSFYQEFGCSPKEYLKSDL
jgi:AraC-like DNA-binding protein